MRRAAKMAWGMGWLLVLLTLLATRTSAALLDPILDPLRDFLVRTITGFVSKSLNGSIEVGALRGSLLSSPVLQNVVLRNKQGEILGQIEEIRLAYDLKTLLKQRLDIQSVEIVQPRLTVMQEPDGSLNLTNLLAPAQPAKPAEPSSGIGLPFAIVLERLQVRDGLLSLRLPALPGVQTVSDMQALLSAQMDRQGLRAEVQQFTAQTSPANVDLRTLQGAFQAHADSMQIEHLRLQTGQTTITAHGVLPGKEQTADFDFQMQPLDITEIGRLLHHDALQGQLHLALQAAGPPDALRVHSQISLAEGQLTLDSHMNLKALPLRYSATLDMTHLNLATLVAQDIWRSDITMQLRLDGAGLSPSELRGEAYLEIQPSHLGDITLNPSQIHLTASGQRLEVQRLDLDTSVARLSAAGALDLGGSSDLQYELATNLVGLQQLLGMATLAGTAHLHGQASGTWPALNTHGTLQARDLRYQENQVNDLQLTYSAAQLGAQPQVTAQLLVRQVQAGAFPVEQVSLDATYQGDTRQVRFDTAVVQAAHTGGKARGMLTLDQTGQQVVLEDLQVQLPDRAWHAAAPLQVSLAAQQIAIKQVHLVHANESIEISGTVDGEQLNDVRVQVTQLDLSYLQRLLHLPDLVGGRATLQVQLAGTRAQPQLQGDLALSTEAGQKLPFERLQSTLVYKQQQFQSTVRVQQANREVLALDLQLPVDMALSALPLGQRLQDAPLSLRLHLKQPNLAALPHLAGTLQGTVDLHGNYATLHLDTNLQLQQLGLQGTAEQLSAPVQLTGTLTTAASVPELAQALQQGKLTPQVQNLQLRIPTLRGQLPASGAPAGPFQVQDLVLQADGQWTANGLRATLQRLHLQASGLGLPSTEVTLGGQLTPQRLELTRLLVRQPQSEIQGQGHLTLPEQQLQFRFDIPRLRLDTLPFAFPPQLPPVVQGGLTIRGSIPAPQVEARLQYAGAQIGADLAAQLQERLPRYRIALRIDGLDAAQVLPKAQGKLRANVQLQGQGFSGEQRQATLNLSVDSDGFSPAPGLTTRVQASLAGETLQVKQFQVRSAPLEFQASGSLSAARQAALQYRLSLGDLASLQPLLGMELQAKGTLTGEAQGTLNALQTRGTLRLDAWRVADWQGQRLQATYAATRLPGDPQATLKAQIAGVQGPSLPKSSLQLDTSYASQRGTFAVAVTEGPYQRTQLNGNIALTEGQSLTLGTLRIKYQDLLWENAAPVQVARSPQGVLQIHSLHLRSGTQEIQVQGSLNAQGVVQAQTQIRQLQVQPTVHVVAPDAAVPDGRLTLDLTVAGTLQKPQLQGQLQLAALQWQKQKLGDIRATIGLSGETLQTELHWQDQGGELLQVQGTLGLNPTGALDLRLQTPGLNLDRLPPLSPAVTQSSGTLRLDLHVTGTRQQPQARGDLVLHNGTLQLAATGERYKDIEAHIVFDGARASIEQLRVNSRSGPLQVTGQIEHAGQTVQQVNLSIQAQNFTPIHTADIEAITSANVTVRGSLQDLEATGSITIPRARMRLDAIPGSGPKAVQPWELTVAGVYGPGPGAVPGANGATPTRSRQEVPLPFLRVNLQVDIPRNVWVQGSGTAIEMSGKLSITKARQEAFILSDQIETVRGYATYYGKKFTVEKGIVTFTGSPEINPLLDVTVTRTISDYVVSIHVGGKAQKPEITFSSIPELPQVDIISLLVLGKTTDRLTGGEQSSLSSQVQQISGGIIAGQLEKLGQSVGLDTIEVAAGDQLGTGSVKAGRYVTQDIFLSYERELGAENSNTVGVEYSLNRRLKLKGTGSDLGETALDLLWRLDY